MILSKLNRFLKNKGWSNVNYITVLRMAGSIALLFLQPMSVAFYIVYLVAGLTDALDGWLARKTNSATDLGAKLDSIADLMFYSAMVITMFPVLLERLPLYMWCIGIGIFVVRLISYLVAAIKFHCFASVHTWMNKMTGAAIFVFPFILYFWSGVGYCWLISVFAGYASLEELIMHIIQKDYSTDAKSIFGMLKANN